MKRELGTASEQGRRSSETRANTGGASQPGSYLAAELHIPGLRHLTDDEADKLVEHLNALADEYYSAGWADSESYNSDIMTLRYATARTEH